LLSDTPDHGQHIPLKHDQAIEPTGSVGSSYLAAAAAAAICDYSYEQRRAPATSRDAPGSLPARIGASKCFLNSAGLPSTPGLQKSTMAKNCSRQQQQHRRRLGYRLCMCGAVPLSKCEWKSTMAKNCSRQQQHRPRLGNRLCMCGAVPPSRCEWKSTMAKHCSRQHRRRL
jgi:hypothetical protein